MSAPRLLLLLLLLTVLARLFTYLVPLPLAGFSLFISSLPGWSRGFTLFCGEWSEAEQFRGYCIRWLHN